MLAAPSPARKKLCRSRISATSLAVSDDCATWRRRLPDTDLVVSASFIRVFELDLADVETEATRSRQTATTRTVKPHRNARLMLKALPHSTTLRPP